MHAWVRARAGPPFFLRPTLTLHTHLPPRHQPSMSALKKVDKKKEVPEKESYKVPRGQPARDQLLCKNGAEAVEKLRKFGVAIPPGFLTPPQCATAFQAVMRDLRRDSPVQLQHRPRGTHTTNLARLCWTASFGGPRLTS